jgi:hypothetical protein
MGQTGEVPPAWCRDRRPGAAVLVGVRRSGEDVGVLDRGVDAAGQHQEIGQPQQGDNGSRRTRKQVVLGVGRLRCHHLCLHQKCCFGDHFLVAEHPAGPRRGVGHAAPASIEPQVYGCREGVAMSQGMSERAERGASDVAVAGVGGELGQEQAHAAGPLVQVGA